MTGNAKQVYAYRAVCEHGKTRGLIVDEPDIMKDGADWIADWLKAGLTLERVTVEEARKSDVRCVTCDALHSAKRKRKKASAEAPQTLVTEERQ